MDSHVEGCGGYVNNLGGGITMMNMVDGGRKLFDCVWLIKPPENMLHRKTHLYVKVAEFVNFAGTTELTIRQGLTSNQPSVEVLRHPMVHYSHFKQHEHVVPIRQGFYISLRGVFMKETKLAIVYAAFNYKDCFGTGDFLCHNLRCVPVLLNCDGFDHCGDNSDESSTCSLDPKDHREFSKIPNFLFPKMGAYSDITTATFVFLTCSFGLIGIILAMALLLYRVNIRERHQRQIQDHIETIHAILEESVVDIEEEVMVPDEPPDYEPPPDYNDLVKMKYLEAYGIDTKRLSQCNMTPEADIRRDDCQTATLPESHSEEPNSNSVASTSRSCQTTPVKIPQSPPPSYDYSDQSRLEVSSHSVSTQNEVATGASSSSLIEEPVATQNILSKLEHKLPNFASNLFSGMRTGIRSYSAGSILRSAKLRMSSSEDNLIRSFSDSELMLNATCKSRSESCQFHKSFSTDDLTMLETSFE